MKGKKMAYRDKMTKTKDMMPVKAKMKKAKMKTKK